MRLTKEQEEAALRKAMEKEFSQYDQRDVIYLIGKSLLSKDPRQQKRALNQLNRLIAFYEDPDSPPTL